MKRIFFIFLALCAFLSLLAACGDMDDYIGGNPHEMTEAASHSDVAAVDGEPETTFEPLPETVLSEAEIEENFEVEPPETKPLIVIDPGHQLHANLDLEPVGPGSDEMKYKVSGGATGISSGLPEYELDLCVALMLRDELEARGYEVVITRTENDVDISNIERSRLANNLAADAFIRIHANACDTPSVHGITVLCPTEHSPYCSGIYQESRRLSDCLLSAMVETTGAKDRGISETDTMSGINWSQVPVCLVEMGFMSNPDEDMKMISWEYRVKLVTGMANGVDEFFSE